MSIEAEQFAAVLSENFHGVTYDVNKKTGTATIPNVGTVKFREATNDPAVIVELTYTKRFKGGAESAIEFVERLQEAWRNSD